MTEQEILAEVEANIRKDIPRLNELSVGCLIKDKKYEIIYKVYDETTHHLRVFELNSELPNTLAINKKHIDSFEIVGYEIMLNDVLEWIKFNAFNVEFQENGDFNLYRELKLSKSIERYNFVNWDLSKPLLKDQLEELIKFLYNLIKQQKWNN